MGQIHSFISMFGVLAPFLCLVLFCASNLLVVWRLEELSKQGVEGTVLGTIFMPFCSGMGNIVFAVVLARQAGRGEDVLINCLFNNITNLTLLIGLPALLWSMDGVSRKRGQKESREFSVGRLSLSLNLVAAFFFALFLRAMAADFIISQADGLMLIALFIFWQCFHIYDVKKTNLLQKKKYPKTLGVDVVLLLVGALAIFISTDWLVQWFGRLDSKLLPPSMLGWASGVLMVLPNALLAFYYGSRNRMDVVYTSQAGDAHICIPFCVGLFAVFHPIVGGVFLQQALFILMGLCALHLIFIIIFGRLPRWFAAIFVIAFLIFVMMGARHT